MWATIGEFLCSDLAKNLLVLVGVIVAIVSVLTARSIARKKQSADLLFASRGDVNLQKGYQVIEQYHNNGLNAGPNILTFAGVSIHLPANATQAQIDQLDELRAIKYVLNHFETVSIGIQAGIYDETMIKNCWCSILLSVHEQTVPLIKGVRTKQKTDSLYQEFDWLVTRWKKAPLRQK